MGLIMEFDGVEGYESVPLLLPDGTEAPSWGGMVLRRRTARPSRRAVLYVHALDDDFIAPDQVAWYTDRGFHFYAADLRAVSDERPAAGRGARMPDLVGRGRVARDPVVPGARRPADTAAAGPTPWDTATFDALRFDEYVREREQERFAPPPAGAATVVPISEGARRAAERALPADVTRAAEELGECFASLDAAVAHMRGREGIGSVVLAAHAAGALVAALWAHARRGSPPAEALILANPAVGDRPSLLARVRARMDENSSGRRNSPLLVGARRRVRRGLDISCPVLVMSPSGGDGGAGGGWLATRLRLGDRVPARLGAHVTWLSLEAGPPGQSPAGLERKRYFEELGRWLGAYLSAQVRDQLL